MICFAVIDTKVPVSALLSSKDAAAAVQVVGKLLGGEIIPVFSNDIMKKYREVLNRKKFGFSPNLVNTLLTAIGQFGILLEPTASGVTPPDMKNLPLFHYSFRCFAAAVSSVFS